MIEGFNLKKILAAALKKGGDFAELYAEETESLQLISEERKLDKINPVLDSGIGLRVLWNGKTAYGFTNECTEATLLKLADGISAAVKADRFEKPLTLTAVPPPLAFEIKKSPDSFGIEAKRELIRRGEGGAWAFEPRIRRAKVL